MEDYKKITLDSYKKNSVVFSEYFMGLFDNVKRSEFLKFLNYLPGKIVLDVGCGAGDHAKWFMAQRLDVVAIDLSPEMVEIARKKGVNAKVMDMENIEFDEKSFDGIWAVTSLLHLKKEKISGMVNKFSSILKNNGILFLAMKEGDGEGFEIDKQNSSTKRYFSYWQERELLDILENRFELIDSWKCKHSRFTIMNILLRKK